MAGAVAIHRGTTLNVCKLPQQHAQDPGIGVQEIIPIPHRVPCLKAVGLQAVCQQHWNHAVKAEVHGDSWKALHYVDSKAESSLQGKVGSLSDASNTVPNFHAFALEDSFYLCDKFGKFSIILKLVGKENVISVFPSLVGLHSKLPLDSFVSVYIRIEHVLDASHLTGHMPSICGLVGSSLGSDPLCCLEGGEVSELLGHFRVEFLALHDQLVDLCPLVPA